MDFLLTCGALALGAIAGSFLNALSFRFGTGRSVLRGRSRCMRCGHTLGALDLVPIFSYLFLRGRCRYCSTRVSLQYPLVEAAAALVSLAIFLAHPQEPLAYLFWFVVWMTLLFVVVYDLRHTVIPWSCSILLAVLALLYLALSFGGVLGPTEPAGSLLWSALAGPVLALPLFFISFVSKGAWMGWGDGALELSLGWFLGLSLGATALMFAFWIGATVGIVLILLKRGFRMGSEIPFAPFLVLGAFIVYVFHIDLFNTLPLLLP